MPPRHLLITADDFGIGPETSRGILDLAERGIIRSTVLLVNSPFARESVRLWKRRGRPIELGWHPCLTLDRPVLPAKDVPSLVDRHGKFFPLSTFLRRLLHGRILESEIESELSAQYERFLDLAECLPLNVNAHHHVHVFGPVRRALGQVLNGQWPVAYVRQVRESLATIVQIPGARLKRLFLTRIGRPIVVETPGNHELIGITNPECVNEPEFFIRWIRSARTSQVELACHPGYFDETLVGRDGTLSDGQIHRREHELQRLMDTRFLQCVHECNFQIHSAEEWATNLVREKSLCQVADIAS